jgi:NADH-quinone oxidoreductase subunit K
MNELALLQNYQFVAAMLFVIGLVGFLVRRNMIVMFLCAELMLQGVSLSLVSFGRWHNDWGGQMMVVFIIAVAACEAGIALALILMLYYRRHNLDIAGWQNLREENQPPYIDVEVPEERDEEKKWPRLTPAGRERQPTEEEKFHRSHV